MSSRASQPPPELPGLAFIRSLGSGGYAEVFLYEQNFPRRRVAVKVLSAALTDDHRRQRFTEEANAMARIGSHPNIVQVFMAGVAEDGRPFIVMQLYPRPNLDVRSREGRLPVAEVVSIGVRIACAVETAHRAGIVHRDIKPANILTDELGGPGLTDFGIATTRDDSGDTHALSPPWAPPEVALALAPAGERSDVYSLGATLWHALVGHAPFQVPGGDNGSFALLKRIREQAPPKTGRGDVPGALEHLLSQTMAKTPNARPESALALAEALQRIEVAERWPPTPLQVLTELPDVEAAPVAEADGTASRTRADSFRIVPAQSGTPTMERATEVFPGLDGRGGGAGEAAPRTASRRWVVVAGVAAVAVAAVVAVLLTRPAANGAAPAAAASSSAAPLASQAPTVAPDPGTPAVQWTRADPAHVTFTWTYANPSPGDDFRWREVGRPWTVTSTTSATVAVPAGHQRCIEVQVGRQSGVNSAISDPVCGG